MDMDNYRQLSVRTRWMLSIAHVFKTFSWPAAFMWVFLFIISTSVVVGANFLQPRRQVMILPFSSLELKEWEAYAMIQSSQGASGADFLANAEERSRSRGFANAWVGRTSLENMTKPNFASPSISSSQIQAIAKRLPNTAAALAEHEALRQKLRGSLSASTTCRNYADKIFGLSSPGLSPSFDDGCIAANNRESFTFIPLLAIFGLSAFSLVLIFGYSLRSGTLPSIFTIALSSSKEEWLAACGAATLAQMESAIFSLASWSRWRSPKPKAKRL